MQVLGRRNFLKLAGAAALMTRPCKVFAASPARVVVVGAGILGASIAYHLARRGATVTVLEKNEPASGTTKNSFAWLNGNGKAPRNYYNFNLAGMLGWRRLELEIGPELPMQWGGGVSWLQVTPEQMIERRKRLSQRQSWGYPVYEVDAERIRQLVPGSRPGDTGFGQFCDIEGTVDPVAATKVLVEKAKQLGATVIYPCEVTGLDLGSGKIQGVQTTQGKFETDYLVLAAGNDTPRITKMAGFDVPLIESKGILAHTKPHPRCLDRVIMVPGTDAKQHLDGRIVTGQDFGNSGNRAATVELGQSYIDHLAKFLPAAANAEIEFMTLGHRVMPRDGHPIIDRAPKFPNMHVVAQHSGMTCAPIVGQLMAIEVLDQVEVDLLQPYRLSRFS